MHCPLETPSPWQGMGLGIQKPKKKHLLDKIHMLFCNEFSIFTIFTGDSMSELHTPGAGGPGVQLLEAHGLSILKAQENPF